MNTESRSAKILRKTSNVLSGIFSPLLVPTYAYAIALWITYISFLPEHMRLMSCVVILIVTALIPLGLIIFMMSRGKIKDAALSERQERTIPYSVTIVCYIVAAYYLEAMPSWLKMFFVGAAVAALIDTLINIRWKVSAHMTSMGGLCAMVMYIATAQIATVKIISWIALVALVSGAVGSARLYLGHHTPAQVYTGWLIGLSIAYACMSI